MFSIAFDFFFGVLLTVIVGIDYYTLTGAHNYHLRDFCAEMLAIVWVIYCFYRVFYHLVHEIRKP